VIRHLLRELRGRHSDAEVTASLEALVVVRHDDDGVVVLRRGDPDGTPLLGARHPPATVVHVAPKVYASTPTEDARVRLLREVSRIAPRIEVHAPIITDGSYRGRLAIDGPRRVLAMFRQPTAEPGDRFTGRFVHAFFDDEEPILEARRARLHYVARQGPWLVLSRDRGERSGTPPPFAVELGRALPLFPFAERLRRTSPADAIAEVRKKGTSAIARDPVGRARLRRAIGWIDALYPTGANCFRRILVEVALDGNAAREALVFGLDVGRTGHVAFKDTEDRTFDVAFEIPPPSAEETA
jgi:hypothetical protein